LGFVSFCGHEGTEGVGEIGLEVVCVEAYFEEVVDVASDGDTVMAGDGTCSGIEILVDGHGGHGGVLSFRVYLG